MGSSVMGESPKAGGDRTRLSLSINTPPSSSPFPSPSSSFLPPPMPDAHEFALRHMPQGQAKKTTSTQNLAQAKGSSGLPNGPSAAAPGKDGEMDGVLSPTTPTPSTVSMHKHTNSNELPSAPHTNLSGGSMPSAVDASPPTTITIPTIPSATASHSPTPFVSSNSPTSSSKKPQRLSESINAAQLLSSNPTTPSSPGFHYPPSSGSRANRDSTMSNASSASLTSNRPAPPSPAISRRTSGVSGGVGSLSRANSSSRSATAKSPEKSGDRHSNRQSLSQLTNVLGSVGSRMSMTTSQASPIPPTPSTAQPHPSSSVTAASQNSTPSPSSSSSKPAHRPPIRIRDFAYPASDPRYSGLGADGKGGGSSGKLKSLAGDVPKQNRVKVLNKALMGSAGYKVWKREEKERQRAEAQSGSSSALSSPNSKKMARASIGSARSFSSSVSSASATSDEEDEEDVEDEDEDEDEDDGGWGSFKWGMGRLSWNFGNSNPTTSAGADSILNSPSPVGGATTGSGFPSKSDLDRNFTTDDPSSSSSSSNSSDTENDAQGADIEEPSPLDYDHADDDDDDDEYYDGEEGYVDEDAPLYPGLYRALYAFEPEGTAEMALEEDQIVRVVGRGGGVGWAVVIVGGIENSPDGVKGERKHALVPESYLEVVKLDGEDNQKGKN